MTNACLVSCVLAAATLAQPGAPQPPQPPGAQPPAHIYGREAGPLKPTSADISLNDPRREITLPVRVRFPEAAPGPVPLIIFSHGMGGSFDAFDAVTSHWVSHGYVVVLPTHTDSVKRQGDAGRAEFLKNPDAYRRRVDPVGRVDDVKLILDSLDTIETLVPGLRLPDGRALIDRQRPGIAGHSAGALTAQMAFGAKVRTLGSPLPRSVGDPRFHAAVVISGQGTTTRILTKESWSAITGPMLVITGSLDTAAAGAETPETRQHPYRFAPPGDKYLLFIEGATHSSYQGKDPRARAGRVLDGAEPGTDLAIIGDAVKSQTLAFWDTYLKQSPESRAFLAGDHVRAIDAAIKPEHK